MKDHLRQFWVWLRFFITYPASTNLNYNYNVRVDAILNSAILGILYFLLYKNLFYHIKSIISSFFRSNRLCRSSLFLSIEPIITLPKDYSLLPYYLSFNIFDVLVVIFYIFTFFLVFIVPYFLYFTFTRLIEKQNRLRFTLVFIFFSILFFFIPISLLIISSLTAIPSLLFHLYFNYNFNFIERILFIVISNLERIGFLKVLRIFYSNVFFKLNDIEHFLFIQGVAFMSLGYLIISRFYFFFVITNNLSRLDNFNYLLLTLSLYLCLCIWGLRLFLNFSFFIINTLPNYYKNINKPIFLINISPIDNPTPTPSPSCPSSPSFLSRHFSLWNRHTYTNYNSYSRPRWYYYGNLTLGGCTLLLGCFGAYIGYQMWQTTERSNIAMDRNSAAMQDNSQAIHRQSDQADVEAGRMTELDYMKKWATNPDFVNLSDTEKLKLIDQWKRERKSKDN